MLTLRRSIDIALSATGLLGLGLPIGAMIGISRIESGQSGMFRQQRYGLGGKPYEHLKIRCLTDELHPLPIAGLFRKIGVDELPQLFNILKGEMSFIGSRPCLRFLGDVPGWKEMLEIPPGLTGLSTVTGKERGVELEPEQRVEIEMPYVKLRLSPGGRFSTFATDMQIAARTLKILLGGRVDIEKHHACPGKKTSVLGLLN